MQTRFTDLVGCRLPLQLAVLGGVGTLDLALAVHEAGGLGMVPWPVPLTSAPSLVGKGLLVVYAPDTDQVAAGFEGARVAEFFWGHPDPAVVAAGHEAAPLVSWQVGSAEEAKAAQAAGCDLVVAQGREAGGHVRGRQPLDELLPAVLAAVDVPVVAAGGIGSAERVAELLGAGADAVRVGTRFLACPECNTHPDYVAALIAARGDDTTLTEHFDNDGAWPAPVRVLRQALDNAAGAGNRSTMPPTRGASSPMSMACYAGMSVDFVTEVKPAREVVAELTTLLRR
ncbi:MAG TPA: nitronate monooxygenase [Candidatus Dormibacteraeota bacterium]